MSNLGAFIRKYSRYLEKNPRETAPFKGLKYDQPLLDQSLRRRGFRCAIIQQKPQNRTILTHRVNWNGERITNSSVTQFLSFPYTIFILQYLQQDYLQQPITGPKGNFVFVDLSVGFSPFSVKSERDYIWKLPLGNYNGLTDGAFRVCMGDVLVRVSYSSLKEMSDHIISGYWQSEFTIWPKEENWKLRSPRPIYYITDNTGHKFYKD